MIVKTKSRNTRENAVFTEQLLAEHGLQGVLLMTPSMHMPRALETFRTAGIDAVAAPTDFTVTYRDLRTVIDFLPDAGALAHTTHAIKEYIGYAYYSVAQMDNGRAEPGQNIRSVCLSGPRQEAGFRATAATCLMYSRGGQNASEAAGPVR